MTNFTERCEDACNERGIYLTDSERLQIAEMECEGLFVSQAPQFIENIRTLKQRAA